MNADMLATIRHPAGPEAPAGAPPLVIVHGLYGSARNWNAIGRTLSRGREVLLVDQRNHGDSPHHPTQSYPEMAADLAEILRGIGQPADLLGHSMGGKTAMQLALTEPALIRRLIVADIAPVAYSHDQSQYARAMLAMDLTGIASRAEADRRLAPLVDDPGLRAFFLQSLDLKAEGGPRWKLNLPVLRDQMPNLVGWPGTPGAFDHPTLFLTGAESQYVRPDYRAQIRAQFPKARFAKLPGAGHWLHADKPREFEETVQVFLTAP